MTDPNFFAAAHQQLRDDTPSGENLHRSSEVQIQDSNFVCFESCVETESKCGTHMKTNILLVNKDYLPKNVVDIRFTKYNEYIFVTK